MGDSLTDEVCSRVTVAVVGMEERRNGACLSGRTRLNLPARLSPQSWIAVIGWLGPNPCYTPLLLRPGKIPLCWERTKVPRTSTIHSQLTDNQLPPAHSLLANYYSLPINLCYCCSRQNRKAGPWGRSMMPPCGCQSAESIAHSEKKRDGKV